jgi:hypothetical protein
MGSSPRSRWSNRDDSSYQSNKDQKSPGWRPRIHNWRDVREGSASPLLLIGQATSIASLVMLFSGVEANPTSGTEDGFQWGLGIGALFATFGFSTASFLALFRVIISSRATRRRKRTAKLWLLGFVGASIYISFN